MNYTSQQLDEFIVRSLAEDVGDGDHTSLSTIPNGTTSQAKLLVKENGILAGLTVVVRIFEIVDPKLKVNTFILDGHSINIGDIVLTVSGDAQSILKAERLVLNTMQRMSGIATITHQVVEKVKGTQTKILDTRKTTPGIRFLEKEAVKIGGGYNHRFGLFDMILIKDNHVDYAGGIKNALENAHQYLKTNHLNLPIEIETRNLKEVGEALEIGGFKRIMFDNFSFKDLVEGVKIINHQYETEASGGITIENVREYAECGVTHISIGALTHSVKSLDLSLKAF